MSKAFLPRVFSGCWCLNLCGKIFLCLIETVEAKIWAAWPRRQRFWSLCHFFSKAQSFKRRWRPAFFASDTFPRTNNFFRRPVNDVLALHGCSCLLLEVYLAVCDISDNIRFLRGLSLSRSVYPFIFNTWHYQLASILTVLWRWDCSIWFQDQLLACCFIVISIAGGERLVW